MTKVEHIAEGVTLYLGDCREMLPSLGGCGAIVTDPPYGIGYFASQPRAISYGGIIGDAEPFDPTPLISKEAILWGGNNFADRLPIGGWIVWDKRCSAAADKMMGSPFELAWSQKRTLFKMIRVQHGGAKNADAPNGDVANEARFHPTQKPVRVMAACIELVSADPIIDPFMGSGSTGVAAVLAGRPFTGIEIEPKYFDIACKRIEQATRQQDLFIEKPKPIKQEAML